MIIYDEKQHIFQLNTKSTSYMIGITPEGYLGHIYYGERLQHIDGGYLLRTEEYPYTPERNKREKCVFLESFPMELPSGGIGDFRESCLDIRDEYGCLGTEILYKEHRIYSGKTSLEGLPASFVTASQMDTEDAGTAVQTLELICQDRVLGVEVVLSYTAFEREDVITRSVRVHNRGEQTLTIEKIYSACLDMDYEEDYELLTLPGAWARERRIQRRRIGYGRQSAASIRGESGHQEHPFIALVTPGTTQTQGDVYAMHFVYSGNFLGQVEVSQHDMIRMTMGIHSYEFGWKLTPGQSFQAPEVVLDKIGILLPEERSDMNGSLERAELKSRLEENGYDAALYFAKEDADTQISQIRELLQDENLKALVISPVDPYSLSDVLQEASDQSIPVIDYDDLIMDTDKIKYYVTFNTRAIGNEIGKNIVKQAELDKVREDRGWLPHH